MSALQPLPEGFRYVPYNDLPALEAAVTEKTCGVLVEPIQGESGVIIPAPGYLQGIRRICDEKGLLMIADEVQTGIGRTGTLFACEQEEVMPDMITLAKALGNGFPIGALLAKEKIAAAFVPGSHGSTFGGNPLACAAALATLETILEEGILENCRKVGEYFLSRLGELKEKHSRIREVRGRGLILAVELTVPGAEFVLKCMEKGLLINCTNGNVLRFVPPLILTRQDVDKAVGILDEVLRKIEKRSARRIHLDRTGFYAGMTGCDDPERRDCRFALTWRPEGYDPAEATYTRLRCHGRPCEILMRLRRIES